jgi:hypothetical protein
MATVTVNIERRAVCERCGSVFESQAIPAHQVPEVASRCPAIPKGARRTMVIFRLADNGEELICVPDGDEVDVSSLAGIVERDL